MEEGRDVEDTEARDGGAGRGEVEAAERDGAGGNVELVFETSGDPKGAVGGESPLSVGGGDGEHAGENVEELVPGGGLGRNETALWGG